MNKHIVTSGPTGLARVRSLLAFRHQSPFARLVSTVVAFTVAMFLVLGSGAAFAEDTAPAPVETTDTTPAEEPAEEPAEAPAEEPAEEPAQEPAEEPAEAPAEAPAEEPGGESDVPVDDTVAKGSQPASGPMMTTLKALAEDPSAALVGNADCEAGSGTLVGGFEIDGDPCDEAGIDFNGGPGDSVDDPFGDDDETSFTGGSSESTNPATWSINGPKPTGKADIGTVWAYSANVGGTVYAYFGFTNDSTSGGTQDYSLEYNQAEPVNGLPVRTPGDLLFHFFSGGNNVLDYEASYIYTLEYPDWTDDGCKEVGTLNAGWCPKTLPADAFESDASSTGEFVEGSIDISALFGAGTCSGTFGTTFLRSAPGAFWTSQMKDYVAPLDVTTPSTCGSLEITKTDADTDALVAGAVFGITGDPRPGGDPADTYCVFDGVEEDMPAEPAVCDFYVADGTADGIVTINPVEPGDYTVTELVAPPGYLLNPEPDPGNSQDVDVDDSEAEEVSFANHRKWDPLDVTKSADGTFSALYTWSVDKLIGPTATGPWSDDTTAQDPLVKDVEDGGDTSLYYQVVVNEESRTTSDYVVSGTIEIDNPNDESVTATIDESLTGCTIAGQADPATVVVPAGGDDYSYVCDLGDGPVDAGTNTVTVTWDKSDYPQTVDDIDAPGTFSDQDTDGYTFEETESTDQTVTVTDDHFDFDPAWVITWGDEADGTYESAVYSFDTEAVAGTCSEVITNTATITGDDATLDQDSESGQVCVEADLSVDVTSLETLTRSFLWDIDKSTTTPEIEVENGEATATYHVTITALPYEDAGWDMYGTVTITNPNAFTDKLVSDLDIAYSGGGTCAPTEALPNVPAGGSSEVDFDCDFAAEPVYDGDVTVTVKWDGDAESASDPTPWSVTEADWLADATLVNEYIKVFDDHAVPGDADPLFEGNQLQWQDVYDSTDPADHQVEVEYEHTFTGDELPPLGECVDLTNTAWFTGDDPEVVLDSDTATVEVCNPYALVQALKIDFETQEPLAGATFELFDGETSLGTAVSGEDGLAKFDAKLVAGSYTIVEIEAPAGYGAPINDEGTVTVTITADDLTLDGEGGHEYLAPFTFRNPAEGELVLLPKAQFERDPLSLLWVPSDGVVEFGDEIRYVVPVESEGEKIFHDVTLTDYVPGWNPDDVTTSPAGTKADLVVDSITCGGGITCTSEVDLATGLITWHLTEAGEDEGTFVGDASGWVEFVVRMPDIPGTSPIQTPGTAFAAALWNQAYLDWSQLDFVPDEENSEVLVPAMTDHELESNEVVVTASATLPPEVIPPAGPKPPSTPGALPATGGPDQWLLLAGLVLLVGGGTLVAGDRRRKHRS